MDKTVKNILSDLNTESKEKSNQVAKEVEKKLFSLGCDVYSNETLIFKTQWTIEENRRMILNNYHAAFSVNTKLANNNTKEIFQNRESILSKYNVASEVEKNYVDFLQTKAHLDLLEHRINLNKDVLEISNDILTGKIENCPLDGKMKNSLMKKLAVDLNIDLRRVIAVGDGANDIPMISNSGLGIAFRAKPKVSEASKYAIKIGGLDTILYFLGIKDV